MRVLARAVGEGLVILLEVNQACIRRRDVEGGGGGSLSHGEE